MHCKQDPLMELSLTRRVVIFIIGVVESMLFAGTVFGWPQLVHVFKVEGLYSHLCDDSTTLHHNHTARPPPAHNPFNNTRCWDRNTTFQFSSSHKVGVEQCEAQDERFALIFTVTVGCYSVPAVLVGFLLHHAGLRVTRVSAGSLVSLLSPETCYVSSQVACIRLQLLIILKDDDVDGLPLPGNGNERVAELGFRGNDPDGSGRQPAENERDAVRGPVPSPPLHRHHPPLGHVRRLRLPLPRLPDETREATKDPPPLGKSLWSGSSYLHQFWFFIMLFAINVYQQTYNVWVTGSSCSVREAGLYSMFFSYSNLFTVFFGPLGGAFTDYMVRRARDTPSEVGRRVKEIQAPFWPLLISSLATTITYACILVFRPLAVYISLVAMVVARPCVIAVSTAYLRIRFPAEHFNRLLGIYGSVSSLLMFLQYPHFMWAQHMYYPAHALVLALLVLSYTNPIHLLFTPLMRDAVVIRDQLEEEQLCPVRTLKKTFRESP
ncbi:equilibrative nucleobase transporter 1 isoform X3 [Procambarus clarkii]|uniref:equilibrative nucleobase transporter 1 isoform X3 n=1 Tax=Procambarus clarkii TaxID=6728 RepID=UPI001E676BE9|nr:uncharacterized protein LOC123762700 isoform X3 [Procambarus clarkii]